MTAKFTSPEIYVGAFTLLFLFFNLVFVRSWSSSNQELAYIAFIIISFFVYRACDVSLFQDLAQGQYKWPLFFVAGIILVFGTAAFTHFYDALTGLLTGIHYAGELTGHSAARLYNNLFR